MVYLVREALEEKPIIAWTVEIESATLPITLQVKNGLPLTRKNLKLLEG